MTPYERYEAALQRQLRLRQQKASRHVTGNVTTVKFGPPKPVPKVCRTRRREEWDFVEPLWDVDGISYK